ncbi:MAG: type II toxin-antitoxin system VapC family toxin [Verrucomicrobiae bacterium]|nr:type II toxin-antitoxin system VapC family toxin [Verrucomicrobiae bacterium]
MNYLLDTCVLSEFTKPTPSESLIEWMEGQDEENLFLSCLTLGELEKGVCKLPSSKRKNVLRHWLNHDLTARFSDRILALDENVCRTWGRLCAEVESRGKKMPVMDSLIAATALENSLSLVTRNESDMQFAGVKIVNPWHS